MPRKENMTGVIRKWFRPVLMFLLITQQCALYSQFSIGTWRDHLPYGKCIDIAEAEDFIYVATEHSVFRYERSASEIEKWSKANKLSDVGTTSIEYDAGTKSLIIGYQSGNIDIIQNDKKYGIPDVMLSTIVGDKKIYNITLRGPFAYISCGLGVVVLDIAQKLVKESYFLGETGAPARVTDVGFFDEKIYVASGNRVLYADASNQFLSNYLNWNVLYNLPTHNEFKELEFYKGSMVLSSAGISADTVWSYNMAGSDTWSKVEDQYPFRVRSIWSNGDWFTLSTDYGVALTNSGLTALYWESFVKGRFLSPQICVFDQYGGYWIGDSGNGLAHCPDFTESSDKWIKPSGPTIAGALKVNAYNNNIWVASGGVGSDLQTNLWNTFGISGFVDNEWINISADTTDYPTTNFNSVAPFFCDPMEVAITPSNNRIIYAASWEEGLLKMNIDNGTIETLKGDEGTEFYTEEWASPDFIACGAVTVDNDGVVWSAYSKIKHGVVAYLPGGRYIYFDTQSYLGLDSKIFGLFVASNGYVYALVPGKGLLVLNTNGTIEDLSDDNMVLLNTSEGSGSLPSEFVFAIIEDLDGEIWIGTDAGLAIIYNPEEIFTGQGIDAEQILIEQDGNTQILLETEYITSIEIDGSNKKWIATRNSGVYQLSADGIVLINHFTAENSPLFSNTIYDLAINQYNGEVFMATQEGLLGFFSTATNFDPEMSEVRVFPNPVRPGFDGYITIDGLAFDSSVKITDLSGNLVYETKSEGGRAVWTGLDSDGNKPATGVYTIFITDKEGGKDEVKKLTFIR
jgi:hypothetical protein